MATANQRSSKVGSAANSTGRSKGQAKPADTNPGARPPVPVDRWPDKKLFRIGEVADLLGVEPHVVRFWLQQFRTVRPERSDSGRLLFGRPAAERLLRIRTLLYEQGYTIAGANRALSDQPAAPAPAPASSSTQPPAPQHAAGVGHGEAVALSREVERLQAEVRALNARLQAAQAAEVAAAVQAQALRARVVAEWSELADDLANLAAEVRG